MSQGAVKIYRKALVSLTEGFGSVSKVPNRMMGVNAPEEITYRGCYDRISNVLLTLGDEYDKKNRLMAGEAYRTCGKLVEGITDRIIRYYCDSEECLQEIPGLFLRVRELEEKAFEALV